MANRILKGLAVAAGTGLAMGFTSGRARVRLVHHEPAPQAGPAFMPASSPAPLETEDDFLNIEPLLDRLERVEARIESIERRPSAAPAAVPAPRGDYAAALADLERRLDENTRDLALLREHVTEAERRMTQSVANVEQTVRDTRNELPEFVERTVAARFDDLRVRFDAELEQAHQRTLETFERAIDEKISSRIGLIEKALTDQAGSIEALRVRATDTDNNLQRLVTAIEKLCERAQLIAPAPEPQTMRAPMPRSAFESQFQDAMRREPVVPVVRTEEPVEVKVAAPAFAAEAQEPKKSRFLFRNLLVAGFSLLASRWFR